MKLTGASDATIDLNRIATFAAVAEEKSFAAAARRLRVQRSSISRTIASLESSLDLQLFQRTTRQVALTSGGAALYAAVAPQLLGLREAVRASSAREDEMSGTLRLTAAVDFGATVLPKVIASYMQRYPSMRVELEIGNRVVDLVKEGFDAALRPSPALRADSSLISRKVMELTGSIVASPAYLAARGAPRSPDELASHDWISFRGRPLPPPVPRMGPARIVVDEFLFVRQAVLAGLGVSMLPGFLAHDDIIAGRLVRVLPKQINFRGSGGLYLVYPPGKHVPRRVHAFRDHFLDEVARGAWSS